MLQKLKTILFKQHAQLELIKNVSESCVSDFGSHGNSIISRFQLIVGQLKSLTKSGDHILKTLKQCS